MIIVTTSADNEVVGHIVKNIMFELLGIQLLSYIFSPFLQQEREKKIWIEKQVNMLMKNIKSNNYGK